MYGKTAPRTKIREKTLQTTGCLSLDNHVHNITIVLEGQAFAQQLLFQYGYMTSTDSR